MSNIPKMGQLPTPVSNQFNPVLKQKAAFRFGSLISTGKLVPLLATEPELEGGHRTSAPWMKRMG